MDDRGAAMMAASGTAAYSTSGDFIQNSAVPFGLASFSSSFSPSGSKDGPPCTVVDLHLPNAAQPVERWGFFPIFPAKILVLTLISLA